MTSASAQQETGYEFDKIPVSTKTFTASTNLQIDLKRLFDVLPVTPYEVAPKKRGRKKRTTAVGPQTTVAYGSIITLKYENQTKGNDLKKKSSKPKARQKWFRNSFTVVIQLDKIINFKICRNGTFQMTGCKVDNHAHECVKYIWKYINDKDLLEAAGIFNVEDLYTFTQGEELKAVFIPAMRNIDFTLGFLVDREKLAHFMATQTEFHCLLETSFGYTGVNIKIPLKNKITELVVHELVLNDGETEVVKCNYDRYLGMLTPKERENKLKQERYNTFLVFHSGKVIMSGMTDEFMRDTFNEFLRIIRTCEDQIKEKLDAPEIVENDSSE